MRLPLPAIRAPGQLVLLHEGEHRLVRVAEHGDHEPHRDVGAGIAVLVVDDVAARLPERLTGVQDPGWFALELEHHLAVQHVAERRAGVPVRRSARVTGRELHDDRHLVEAVRDVRRHGLLHHGER
ncbi:hypothetical protein GCM10027610_063570 [Dactylosporangium cerinum]